MLRITILCITSKPLPLGFAFGKAVVLRHGKRARPEFFVVQNSSRRGGIAGLGNDEQAFFIGKTIHVFVDAHAGDAAIQNGPVKADLIYRV